MSRGIVDWLLALPIPWLVGEENGIADVNAWGGFSDAQVQLFADAILARFPSSAPPDALPEIGHDSVLIQGPYETDASFAIRLGDRWNAHSRRGQPAEMLAELWYGGFSGAVIVTQNGLAYSLSGEPTPGQDPTPLLVITTLTLLPTPAEPVAPSTKVIPAGSPWWTFDGRTDLCNRFAILFPNGAGPFMTYGIAHFTGTDLAIVTWNNPGRFADDSYQVWMSAPTVTSGSPPGTVSEDVTMRSPGGTVIDAGGPFTGTVMCIAFPTGANPFDNIATGDLNRLRSLVETWKPAHSRCVEVIAVDTGLIWGYPPTQKWGDAGLKWGGSTTVYEVE